MRFFADFTQRPLRGKPIYRRSEHSFDFMSERPSEESIGERGTSSITLLSSLQLEVSIEFGTVLHVWGYHPNKTWQGRQLPPLQPVEGQLRATGAHQFIAGVSIRYEASLAWTTYIDPTTGWVYMGPPEIRFPQLAVAFATDTIAGISEGMLQSIWIKPEFVS